MKHLLFSTRPSWALSSLIVIAILFPACTHLIAVSSSGVPKINIDAFPSGGGNVEQQDIGASGTVNVDVGTNLLFTGAATSPGGVHTFSIQVIQGSSTLFTATATNTPNSSNKVADPLDILGTNGSGGTGNISMLVPNLINPVTVNTSATGFGAGTAGFSVTYVPIDPKQRGKDQFTTVTLQRQLGSNIYQADFPSSPLSGKVVSIQNNSGAEVILLKNGQPATACSAIGPSSSVTIGTGGQTFPADIDALFGPNNSLPVKLIACSNPGNPNPPAQIQITLFYHIN